MSVMMMRKKLDKYMEDIVFDGHNDMSNMRQFKYLFISCLDMAARVKRGVDRGVKLDGPEL